jgi:hypothetical protein
MNWLSNLYQSVLVALKAFLMFEHDGNSPAIIVDDYDEEELTREVSYPVLLDGVAKEVVPPEALFGTRPGARQRRRGRRRG